MARIMIENLFKKILLATDYSRTLLWHFHDHGVDWMHACGGKGRCTTCKVVIIAGAEHFQKPTEAEVKYVLEGALKFGERLACQAKISGDAIVRAPAEYQLPHVHYSDEGGISA